MALAGPMPLNWQRSSIERRASSAMLSLHEARTFLMSPTAVSSSLPVPMSRPNNSAVLNVATPCFMAFSRGRSSAGISFILGLSSDICYPLLYSLVRFSFVSSGCLSIILNHIALRKPMP